MKTHDTQGVIKIKTKSSYEMTPKERFFMNLKGNETDRASVINPTSVATSECCTELGFSFSEVHMDPDKMSALAAYGYEVLGFDSVMPYFSVIQEAAAFDCMIDWGQSDSMPAQKSTAFTDPKQFHMPNDFLDRIPVKTVIDSIKILRNKLGKDALIIGKVMGPWTLSYKLHGIEDFLIETMTDPETVQEFLDKFKQITIEFASAQFESGADIITLADHATADLIGPSVYERFLLPVHKDIIRHFDDRKFILHCCGNTLDRMHLFSRAGFEMFHFDSKNDIEKSINASGKMRLTGCVNNFDILFNGNENDVKNNVDDILSHGIKFVSPECAIPLNVPNANLKAIVETVKHQKQ